MNPAGCLEVFCLLVAGACFAADQTREYLDDDDNAGDYVDDIALSVVWVEG